MTRFEYRITRHPAANFMDLVYFCSPEGECHLEKVANNQIDVLQNILNEMGSEGWELVQLAFGKGGIVGFWKRKLES